MMKATPYMKTYATEAEADARMRTRNRAHRNGDGQIFCLVDGPDDNFAVVDLGTAIELGGPYRWAS
jgi:hypothetical protein